MLSPNIVSINSGYYIFYYGVCKLLLSCLIGHAIIMIIYQEDHMTRTIHIPKPIDCHIHLRDNPYLARTVVDAEQSFSSVIVMPNTIPPIITIDDALAYKKRLQSFRKRHTLNMKMALYLHERTTESLIQAASISEDIIGFKLYPKGATTNADEGVNKIVDFYPLFAAMEAYQVPLLIHPEDHHPDTDIFDRERVFIDQYLLPIHQRFPQLRITLEHVTTQEGIDFVTSAPPHIGATITAHHLWINRNDVINTKIHPHHFCLPIAKRRRHQEALIRAATSGNPQFFLGTDSAPHSKGQKEQACGCAGIYTAPYALALYAEIFAQAGAVDQLAAFSTHNAAAFYGLPVSDTLLTLEETPQLVVDTLEFGKEIVVPFKAGQQLAWSVKTS